MDWPVRRACLRTRTNSAAPDRNGRVPAARADDPHDGPNRIARARSILRREPEPARHQGALGEIEEALHEEREHGRRYRALEHETHVV